MNFFFWKSIVIILTFILISELSNCVRYSKYSSFIAEITASDSTSIDSVFNKNLDITSIFLDSLDVDPSYFYGNYLSRSNPEYPKYYRFWRLQKHAGVKEFVIVVYEKGKAPISFRFIKSGNDYILEDITFGW